jgi:hypothetical protein
VVVDFTELYAVRLLVARQMQKAYPVRKERLWGNSGRRADKVFELDLMGNRYPTVEKEHE